MGRADAGDPPQPARVAEIVDALDGLVVGGGGDLDPRAYGGEPRDAVQVDRLGEREREQRSLLGPLGLVDGRQVTDLQQRALE